MTKQVGLDRTIQEWLIRGLEHVQFQMLPPSTLQIAALVQMLKEAEAVILVMPTDD